MSTSLILHDAQTAKDVLTFSKRALHAGADGIRLQAELGVLAVSSAILAPEGLLDATPTIIGMRVVRADPELITDMVVTSLTETSFPEQLALPDSSIAPAWAGIAPPRDGWQHHAELSAGVLSERARWGSSAVARQTPPGSAENAVRVARAVIWGELDENLLNLPRGIAFAAEMLGFLSDDNESAPVYSSGNWYRVTLKRGHILVRMPPTGLTSVRQTGKSGI